MECSRSSAAQSGCRSNPRTARDVLADARAERPHVELRLYRRAAGLQVRAQYTVDDLLRSQVVRTPASGDDVAAIWKMAVLERGEFVELDREA